ncbi:hypothetical protein NE237_005252 [Protea cynaroides]|uniref:Uncharacterized protein n=1 Tax=Protea cynaroides TaxID=273540 RepID=A0A9Q0KK63_9MAGN|nr:hypothetical protein NE237_005252 [Protea cynaroides]
MDDEKKKNKNKKKRGKQNKAVKDALGGAGGTSSLERNHVDSIEQNHCNHVSGSVDVQAPGVMETVVSLERQHDDGEKSASLEEKIRDLQSEKDLFIQREAGLEKQIINLQNEKDSWLKKEETLEDKIKQLSDEKASCILKGASFEDRIKHLEDEKESWVLKEASFEDRIKHLEDEKESWVLKENSMEEMIGRLDEENTELQAKVRNLEESKGSLVEEKQHLMETISSLQSQLQHLEREASFSASSTTEISKHVSQHDDFNAQIEAGRILVEKLMAENAQLVEKVNELYIELDQRSVMVAHSSTAEFNPAIMSGNATTAENMSESGVEMSASSERRESWESIQAGDRTSSTDNADKGISAITTIQIEESPVSFEVGESEEIVQVPLDDNEVPDNELPAALEIQENVSVPLSAAPLIGAPFRLVSFFAKYVSGADLVNKNTSNSSR